LRRGIGGESYVVTAIDVGSWPELDDDPVPSN
jgi:hypothetical protein